MTSKNIDGGWAWVILACACCSFVLNGFLCYSMGIITEALLEIFDGDLSLTSAVGSAIIGAQCCTGPIAGFISKKIGCRACAMIGGIIATFGLAGASVSRNLYTVLIFGIVTGVGYGLPLTSCSVIVGFYFHRLRPIAAGIAVTGGGIGMFVGPPVVQYLIDQYGLHGAFLLMAGISSHFCIIGSLLRPIQIYKDVPRHLTNHKGEFQYQESNCLTKLRKCDACPIHIWSNAGFMIYLFSVFFWSVAESACLLHLPSYCIQQGTSKTDTALLFAAMGIGNIISRLLTGFAANEPGLNNITFHAGQMGVASVVTGLFPLFSRTYGGQMVYAIGLGIYTSGANSLLNPIIVQLVGLDDLAIGFGLVNLSIGVGYLMGSPIAGAIVDFGATYRESYLFAGAMFFLSSLCAMLIPLVHSKGDDHILPGTHSFPDITIPLNETAVEKRTDTKLAHFKDEIDCELEPLKSLNSREEC